MRSGTVARKLGMTRIFLDTGRAIPVTVLEMENAEVVCRREPATEGYASVQVGAGTVRPSRITKSMRGHYAKAGVAPKRCLAEFRVSEENLLDAGTALGAAHFTPGQYVDVSGTSIGKGFAGAMKRHGFKGLRATHGVSVSHRSHGSTGQCQDPGRVFKGKKMAGQMGNHRVTTQNLEVIHTDPDRNLIMIKGAVPGSKGGWVLLSDAIKKPLPDMPASPPSLNGVANGADGEAEVAVAAEEAATDTVVEASDASASDKPEGEKPKASEK